MFDKLKEIRTAKGVSCEKMAEVLGLETKSAYSKKENGTVKFTLAEAKKISDFLRMTIEDIFFEDEVSCGETKSQHQLN